MASDPTEIVSLSVPPEPAPTPCDVKFPAVPLLAAPTMVRSASLSVLTLLALVSLMRFAQELFVPIVLAILFAYALDPVVSWVTWLRIPRVLATAIVLLGIIAAGGAGLYALRNQAVAAIETLPAAAQQIRRHMRELRGSPVDATSAMAKIQEAAQEIEKTAAAAVGVTAAAPRGVIKVQIEEPAIRASDYFWSGSTGILSAVSQTVMVAFLVFFILASGDLFKRKLVHLIGRTLSEKRVTLDAINEINTQIARFLLIQVLTGALVGVCTAAVLWAFGVQQPAIWGLAAGVLNSIPYFGAIIVSAGIALISFLQFGSLLTALQIAGAALVITSLEGFVLTPMLMGRAARINGVAMFLSLLFWSWLWGAIGMIVAVPLMMAIKIACDRIENLQPIGELLGER
jgi:predicted PurR-regulated permease PerM